MPAVAVRASELKKCGAISGTRTPLRIKTTDSHESRANQGKDRISCTSQDFQGKRRRGDPATSYFSL